MEHLTQQLISYASEVSYADLPQEVVAPTRRVFMDSIGCAPGGPKSHENYPFTSP
jgi:2-methylcitrate dehydratase PrpD